MIFFETHHLSAGYTGKRIIEGISFQMENGCMMGVIGANASGKTTLLKAICGILPHEGNCILEGNVLETLTPRSIARLCGYIPQNSGISIDISALDVVLMGFNAQMRLLEYPGKDMKIAAENALEEVGLKDQAKSNYLHLSEGQKQLCILARALVSQTKLLLMDEPESALDFRYRYKALSVIRNWIKIKNRGAIVTLHDPMLALNYCDKLLLISNGKIIGILTPAVDSLTEMEKQLEKIYGKISLRKCFDRSGRTQIIMLKEQD